MQPGHFVNKKYLIPMIFIGLMLLLVGIVIAQAGIKLDGSSSIFLSPQPKCIYSSLPPTVVNWNGQVVPPPTQVLSNALNYSTPLPSLLGTSYQETKINDFAINMPDQEKTYIYVMHCDGSIELFKVISSGNITNDVPLLPYDFILDWIPPASLMGSRPQKFNSEASVTQLPMTGVRRVRSQNALPYLLCVLGYSPHPIDLISSSI